MRPSSRLAKLAAAGAVLSVLGACASYDQPVANYPGPTSTAGAAYPSNPNNYPNTYPSTAPVALEYGRITNIETVQAAGPARGPNIVGAVVGGVAGAVLGHQIGGGSGRDAATVLGGAAGAAVGSQVGRNEPQPSAGVSGYRITVQTDRGDWRTYEVSAPGDLRVGDRVRVENNVIYRA